MRKKFLQSMLLFAFGVALGGTLGSFYVWSETASKPRFYTTRGVVVSLKPGVLLIKDKQNIEWEFQTGERPLNVSAGDKVKVHHTLNVVSVEKE